MICSMCRRRGLMLYNFYGPGNGRVFLDYAYCEGDEESLVYCSHADFNVIPPSYNTHTYDVSIYCRPGLFAFVYGDTTPII